MVSQQPSGETDIQTINTPESLVEVKRGPLTESRHRGHIVAAEPDGKVIAFAGSPHTVTYMRSSAKPHQALPVVASGAADRFGFSPKEIALACASHSGEPIHTRTAASMLKKIGLPASALKCGTHEPYSAQVRQELCEQGEQPNVLQNNCSGKHAAMLALALHLGAPTESYDQPGNPVQIAIKRTVSQFSGVALEEIVQGIDGCGVPVFGLSVMAMAVMYARLIAPPRQLDAAMRNACTRITGAMIRYPEIIGGTKDRLDTELMSATSGRLIGKVGAEGVYTLAVLPCEEWPRGFGLALKIEDGDDHRARPTVVIEALRQLAVLGGESLAYLSKYASFPVRNRRGEVVGETRPVFELRRPEPRAEELQ